MKCPYDTHKKELTCPYYEKGKEEHVGCWCKFMDNDLCFNVMRRREQEEKK